MSTKVVPAPADQAKQPVRSEKLAKQSEEQKAVQDKDERLADDDSEDEVSVAEIEEAQEQETSLATDFTFTGALAEAAAASGSLITEAEEADVTYGNYGEGGSEGTILLVGAVLLVGLGIAAIASGGSDDPADDVPLNEDPTISTDVTEVTADEDGASGLVTVTTDDPDGDAVTVSAAADNGAVTDNGDGTFTYAPNPDFNGADTITFTADDGKGGTATTTVAATVAPVADDPTVAADVADITVDEDGVSGAIAVTADDADGDTPTTSGAANNGSVTDNGDGTFTYAPNADFNGNDTITFTADDGNGGTGTTTVAVTVTPVNDAPTVDPASTMVIVTDENVPFDFIINGNDVDGDTIGILNTGPANGTLTDGGDADPTTFTYTPNADFFGDDDFDITLDDGNGETVTYTVDVTVNEFTGPVPLSLDDLAGASTSVLGDIGGDGFDDATGAGAGATVFTTDATSLTNVAIGGFGLDDVIQVTNATAGDYSFSGAGSNLSVVYSDPGNNIFEQIEITFEAGVALSQIAFDYDSAVAALGGYEFMTFG